MNTDEEKVVRIKKILAKYHLELILPIVNLAHKERFFVFKARDESGKLYTIKFMRQIEEVEEDVLLKFKNEILFLEYLEKKHFFSKQITQRILARDFIEGWRIAEYLDGKRISKKDDFYPYNPDLLRNFSSEEIVNFFYKLQQIDVENIQKEIPTLPVYDLKRHQDYYQKMEPAGYILSNLENNYYNFLTKSESKQLLKIYLNPWQEYFYKNCVVHADINPENILLGGNNFYILDWENVGIGAYLSDFTNFWIRSYLNPEFQNRIFDLMILQNRNKDIVLVEFYRTYLLSFLGVYEFYCLNKSLKKIGEEGVQRATEFLINTFQKAKNYV